MISSELFSTRCVLPRIIMDTLSTSYATRALHLACLGMNSQPLGVLWTTKRTGAWSPQKTFKGTNLGEFLSCYFIYQTNLKHL
jgi:hypothetical protein